MEKSEETPESNFPKKPKCLNEREEESGKKEEEKRYHQVRLSMKKYIRRISSQVHRKNAKIWPNHGMMDAMLKKKMVVLPAKIASSPE